MPGPAPGPLVGAERDQRAAGVAGVGQAVRHVEVGRRQRALAGPHRRRDHLDEQRHPPRADEVAGPGLGRADPAGLVRRQLSRHIRARIRPFTVVAASGRSSVIGPSTGP